MTWERLRSQGIDAGSPYYCVMRLTGDGMEALRTMFPDGEANDLNFVLFSTSGVHGSYATLEEVEEEPDLGLTFLIVQPRIVGVRYGNCEPKTPEDFAFLRKLRASSWRAVATIGVATTGKEPGGRNG